MPSKDLFQQTGSSSKRGNKNQPNINDEGEFPSLFDVKPSSSTANDSNQKTNSTSNDRLVLK